MPDEWRIELIEVPDASSPQVWDVRLVTFTAYGPLQLIGKITQDEEDPAFVSEVRCDDFFLGESLVRQILRRVFLELHPYIGQFGDCGVVSPLEMPAWLEDYLPTPLGAEAVARINATIRTFYPESTT